MVTIRRAAVPTAKAPPAPVTPVRRPEPTRMLTPGQERAIRVAMQIFVDEDRAFGANRTARRWCARCKAERPGAGFIAYEDADLCNPCATQYELARARGIVWTPQEFLVL